MAIVLAASLAENLGMKHGLKTIVLVHRRFLALQFLKEAEGIIPGQAHFIDDNELNFDTTLPFYICTENRASKLNPAFRATFKLMIVDEAKYWCTPSRLRAMLQFQPTHTIGLCAERERQDGYHVLLDYFFGRNIYRKSCKPFTVWKYQTSFQPTIQRPSGFSKAKVDWNVAMNSLAFCEDRNAMICNLSGLLANNKIIVFVTLTDHVDILHEMMLKRGIKAAKYYKSMSSFQSCRVLITTYAKAEMGFDDKNLCEEFDGERIDSVILGSFYKDEIEQTVGRVFRADAPNVFDLTDDYKSLRKHSASRDKWYLSRNGKIMPTEYLFPIKSYIR
jgi:superfamily II DNA or RNA helicase